MVYMVIPMSMPIISVWTGGCSTTSGRGSGGIFGVVTVEKLPSSQDLPVKSNLLLHDTESEDDAT